VIPRRIRWAGQVAKMGKDKKCIQNFLGIRHLKNREVDGRIALI
jgi:hypothetical protein